MHDMTQAEREAFLAGLHVGVLSVADPAGAAGAAGPAGPAGRGPLVVPVWYSYQPGGVVSVATGSRSRKARAIREAGRFSLCAQDEQPPYKYVTVEGPAVIEESNAPERLELARRYLGTEGGDAFIAANPGRAGDAIIRMTPERWISVDYGQG
jgi:nitroimidazol reductase NimA-like FMN-containing flavoprotein (pyridoxamine 5'-phosphate oxidase superfamily)